MSNRNAVSTSIKAIQDIRSSNLEAFHLKDVAFPQFIKDALWREGRANDGMLKNPLGTIVKYALRETGALSKSHRDFLERKLSEAAARGDTEQQRTIADRWISTVINKIDVSSALPFAMAVKFGFKSVQGTISLVPIIGEHVLRSFDDLFNKFNMIHCVQNVREHLESKHAGMSGTEKERAALHGRWNKQLALILNRSANNEGWNEELLIKPRTQNLLKKFISESPFYSDDHLRAVEEFAIRLIRDEKFLVDLALDKRCRKDWREEAVTRIQTPSVLKELYDTDRDLQQVVRRSLLWLKRAHPLPFMMYLGSAERPEERNSVIETILSITNDEFTLGCFLGELRHRDLDKKGWLSSRLSFSMSREAIESVVDDYPRPSKG
jgi:hypothetical protein